MGLTFQGKLAWAYISSDSLWARFNRAKHHGVKDNSQLWNSINHLIPTLRDQAKWVIGRGEINAGTWGSSCGLTVPSNMHDLPMRTIVSSTTLKSDLSRACSPMFQSYLDSIVLSHAEDRLIWTGSSSGQFSIKEFLTTFRTRLPMLHWPKAVWNAWLPLKVAIFVWCLIYQAIPTDDRVSRMGISMVSMCSCCNSFSESSHHLFFQGQLGKNLRDFITSKLGGPSIQSVKGLIVRLRRSSPKDPKSWLPLGAY
ncbi:hypothetical protein QQ045_019836 [Rhodiola kirilowii]